MRIRAVEHALPGRRVTNELVVESLREHNQGHLTEDQLDSLLGEVSRYLEAAGTEVRYHLSDGELAVDIALEAGRRALATADIAAEDVDFLIYAGVSRGWVEPATGPVFQAGLGLINATCFDVLDACAGWLRALHVADSYFRAGVYRIGAIVCCECGIGEQAGWVVAAPEDLAHRAAAYTIGEASTVAIVDDGEGDEFYFNFRTLGQHVDLCLVPLPGIRQFHQVGANPQLVSGQLFSLSRELVEVVSTNIVQVFRSDPKLHGTYDVCFGHEVSKKVCDAVTRELGLRDIYFPTHHRFGNTVSASVSLGMSVAFQEGRLKRGDRVLLIVGASGVTVGLAAFTF